jgi:hypothetical protein
MVCMNTAKQQDTANNERLRELVTNAGLMQADALALVNRTIGVRKISFSTWKGYFVAPGTTRWRRIPDDTLSHVEKVFAKLETHLSR